MALEPLHPPAVQDDAGISRVRRKFWISAALSIPVVVVAMVPHLMDLHMTAAAVRIFRGLELLLTAPVVLWAAGDYYRRGWAGIRHRSPNMYTLIGLGVAVAYLYSLIATFFPSLFPPQMRDEHGMVGVYFEVAASIIALVLLQYERVRSFVLPRARKNATPSGSARATAEVDGAGERTVA
jgi:Cu+-exporting ATPase